MEKAKVYFTDFRCRPGKNNLQKLQKLCKKAGIEQINFEGKFVAIKMHFGELGCLASLRPQYVKAVADLVKELGGRPFLTDCSFPDSNNSAAGLRPAALLFFRQTDAGQMYSTDSIS